MEIKGKIEVLQDELNKKRKLLERFPDLKEHRDRWGSIRLTSPEINEIADEVFINHNCGCCDDSPLQVWPYKKFYGVNVFSQPACFAVGEMNSCGEGDCEWDGWEEKLQEANISKTSIQKVKEHFKEHPARYWTLED